MQDADERLPGEIARRCWVVLALLTLASLPWRSPAATLGVLSGGMVAIGGYHWMGRSLRRMMAHPSRRSALGFQFGYLIRLGALAAVLFLLVALVRVHPVGLAAGVSVVPLGIIWATLTRLFRGGSNRP